MDLRSPDAQVDRAILAMLAKQRRSWEQGVAGHALLDLGQDDLVMVMARDAVLYQTPAGKLAEIEDEGIVNCAANGEAVLWAAAHQEDPAIADSLAQAFERQLHWVRSTAPRAADGTLFHIEGSRQVWVDTVYMVVPLLALTGDVGEAYAQVEGHRSRLFDPVAGVYAHMWGEDEGRLVRAALWGSGTGWVVAGLARALRHLGEAHDGADGIAREVEAAMVAHAREVLDAVLTFRTASGLFHDVLDDPESFEEVNLAQMLAYAVFTGMADGWLPASYEPVGRSLMATARSHVGLDGLVSPVCGAPRFDRPGTSVEAQAFFLLATAAERRWRRSASCG